MPTFSAAIGLKTGQFSNTVPSSSGAIQSAVIYTATAGRKTILSFTSWNNNLGFPAINCNLAIQRKDPFTGSYIQSVPFTLTGGGVGVSGVGMPLSSVKILADWGVNETAQINTSALEAGAGNVRIILMSEDRIVTISGSCPDGSNLKLCGRFEEYYSST